MTSLAAVGKGLKRVAIATGGHLRSPDRSSAFKRAARHWAFMNEELQIPEAYPNEIFPEMRDVHVPLTIDMESDFELPLGERAILAGLVKTRKPRTIFEFGTYTGTTTALLADIAESDTKIHTIDLPASAFPSGGFHGKFFADMVGRHFVDNDDYRDRIVLHRVDIKDFDFTPFKADVELVFVDADHSYDQVVRDTHLALDLVAPGGTIMWDDYQPAHWGVVRALNELSRSVPLRRIAGTRFVIYEAPGLAET
jgi:predicted O-methyltransferase YrrM